jgi:hypothetical protein
MIRKVKILLNVVLYFLVVGSTVSCKKYERNTLYFTPPESILCYFSVDLKLNYLTKNGLVIDTISNVKIEILHKYYLKINNKIILSKENNYCDVNYLPFSIIKIDNSYDHPKKWKIVFLTKKKLIASYKDKQNNIYEGIFSVNEHQYE